MVTSLSSAEMNILFEAARRYLADAENFDDLVEDLDLTDAKLKTLQEKLKQRKVRVGRAWLEGPDA